MARDESGSKARNSAHGAKDFLGRLGNGKVIERRTS
jgi:hypothetical protein